MNRRANAADQMLLYHSEHLQTFRRELKHERDRVMYQYPQIKEVLYQTQIELRNQPQHCNTRDALRAAKNSVKERYLEVVDVINQALEQVYEQHPHVHDEMMQNINQRTEQLIEHLIQHHPQFSKDVQQVQHQMPERDRQSTLDYVIRQPPYDAMVICAVQQAERQVRAQYPQFVTDHIRSRRQVLGEYPEYVTDIHQAEIQVLDQLQHRATGDALVRLEGEILNQPENAEAKQAVRQASAEFVQNHLQGQEVLELVKNTEIYRFTQLSTFLEVEKN